MTKLDKKQHQSLLTMALLFLGFALVGLGYAAFAYHSSKEYRESGVASQAVVTAKRSGSGLSAGGKSKMSQYVLEAQAQDAGDAATSRQLYVDLDTYKRTDVGDSVVIIHLPAKPGEPRLASSLGAPPSLLATGAGMLVLSLAFAGAWLFIKPSA